MSVVYSTRSLSGDRREAWEAVISSVYAPLDMSIGRDVEFTGEITQSTFHDLDLTLAKAHYEFARRTRGHIARDAGESCVFLLVRRGPLTISQFGREVALESDSYSVLDLSAPFVLKHATATESFFLKVPSVVLRPRFRDIHGHCAVSRPVGAGMGRIAADIIASFNAHISAIDPNRAGQLADQILDTLGLVFESGADDLPEGPSLARAAIRRRALAHIERQLSDPELDPASVASAIGISTRYLHRAFQDSGRSVNAHIRATRLRRCREDLADPRFRSWQIGEIASRHGFASQSLFSASFRREFGVSPRDIRATKTTDEA
jgi:AraC-like DNA-binding protein